MLAELVEGVRCRGAARLLCAWVRGAPARTTAGLLTTCYYVLLSTSQLNRPAHSHVHYLFYTILLVQYNNNTHATPPVHAYLLTYLLASLYL